MTDRQSAPETVEESRLTVVLIAVAALGWATAMLWSARATITGRADAAMEVTSTAYALPGAVSACLAAGAAVALLALTLISGRRQFGSTVRFAVATGAGLLVGLAAAVSMITINTAGSMYAIVGGTVAAAATIGGALAGLRIPPVIAGAAAASVGVFLIGFVLNLFQEPVLQVFGAGDTESSAQAAQWFSYSQAALSGLAAGLISYLIVRRARLRTGDDLRWPMYALAGAGPGILLVVAELLSRTAGAEVLELAGKVSELEQAVQQMLSTARLNNGLIVLFAGTLTAIVAVGRSISPTYDDDADAAASPPASSSAPAASSSAAAPAAASSSAPAASSSAAGPAAGSSSAPAAAASSSAAAPAAGSAASASAPAAASSTAPAATAASAGDEPAAGKARS